MPRSPWKGGFFERLIGVVKHMLETTLQCNVFSENHLCSLVKEAEAIVNHCPIMYTGDIRKDEVLTPSHLIRVDLVRLLPPVVPHEEVYQTMTTKPLRHKYFQLTEALECFKQCWQLGYLRLLQERHNFRESPATMLQIGDIVLVKTEQQKRSQWPLGKIIAIYPDNHGVILCYLKVLFEGEEHLRAVEHTVRLEVNTHDDKRESSREQNSRESESEAGDLGK
ncbi:uncharacterized protein LOC135202644 [Macrobrachium nipponense]|uniref:uncharacterized protein LOC135202644 n=1 Tax=Macrobrachium nipponense TaxID=159736 RepID=UPI0030C8874F